MTATLGSTASASAAATTGLVITAGEVTGLDMAVTSSSLQLAGMTIDRTLLTLAAAADEKSLKITGTGTMKGVTGLPSAVKVSLGTKSASSTGSTPATKATEGLSISGGTVAELDMAVMENTLAIDGTTFSNRGLTIAQDGAVYRMTGNAALTPTSESQIVVKLKSSDGLVFSGTGATSTISAFKMIVPEAFSIGGLTITPTVTDSIDGLSFVETISSKTLVLSGKADVSATKFSGTVNLGGNGTAGVTVLNDAVTGIGMTVISSFTAASHSFVSTALSLTRRSGSGSASTFDMVGTSMLSANARNWSTTFSATAADKRLVISGGSVTTLGMTVVPNTVFIGSLSFRGTAETFTYNVTPSNGVGKLTGNAKLSLNGVSLAVDLGASDADGWTYTAGTPTSTMMRSTTPFKLGGVNFDSTDLTIERHSTETGYSRYWEVKGKAKFGLGSGIFEDAIDVTIGTDKSGSGWIASETELSQMQFRVDTGFRIAGAGFTTDSTSGLTVKYSESKAKQTYEMTGGATAHLGASTFKVLFATDRVEGKIPKWQIDTTTNTVSQSNAVPEAQRLPGLMIVNGALRRLDVMASAEWSLAGVSIYARDLHFTYDSALKRMTFSGVAAALIDGFDVSPLIVSYMSGGTAASMTKGLMIEFGDNGSPGIEMVGNDLRTLDVAVSGTFFTGGIFINAEKLRFKWTKVENAAPARGFTETFSMSGSANVRLVTIDGAALVGLATDGQAKGLGVAFGYTDDKTKTTYPGLVVTNGKLDKLDMTVSSSFGIDIKTPIPIKTEFELKKMRFQWDRDFDTTKAGDQSRFNLTGAASVIIEVAKVEVQFGSDDGKTPGLTITEGKLEYFDMTVTGDIEYEGIKLPVGDIQLGAIFVAKTGTLSLWGKGQIGLSVPSELGGSSILPKVSATIGGGSRATALAAIDDPDKNGFIVQGKVLKRLTFSITGYVGGGINGGDFEVSYRRAGTWDNVWHPQRIEFSGTANVNIGFASASMYLGTKAVPGIVIENGALRTFHFQGNVTANLLISFQASVDVDYVNGYMDVTGKGDLGLRLPIPSTYQALARNKDSMDVSLAQVSARFYVNAKNPRSDDSRGTFKVRLFDDLPEINATVRFGAVAKIEGDFSVWDDALKNAAKNAVNTVGNAATDAGNAVVKVGSSVGNTVGNAFKKVKLGPIDGGTVYYDPTGTSLAGGMVSYDPATHFHATTSASGDFALGLPAGTTTGRLVMFGGKDTSTTLTNHLVLVAPLTSSVLSPFTVLQMGIVDAHSRDEATAAARVKAGLGLPGQLNVNTSFYLLVALTGVEPAAAVFASDVEITSLVSMTAASLDGLTNSAGTHPSRQSLGIHAFAALADLVDSAAESGVPLDLTSESTVQAMIAATATRAGIDLSSVSRQSNSASAARVIAALVAKVGAVPIPVSGDPVEMGAALEAMVQAQIVATGVASEQLAAVNAGTATAGDVEASFTGAALDTLVAAQVVGNLDAPQVSFNDPVVVVGPNGSGTATFEVSVTGDPSPLLPISVGYATEDYTATVADGDYEAVSGTLLWAAGDASTKTVTVPVHAGTSLDPRQFFKLKASSVTNAVVFDNGVGEIEQAPVSTTTDLAVSTLQGAPRNTTVLKATVSRDSATHVGYAGSVTFKDGDTVLATVDVDTSGEATWSSSLLAVGEHSFSAVYSGVTTSGYDYLSSQATPVTALVGTPQTLSVTALADITWGASSTMQQVLASSSVGMPVAYAVTGPATIDADGLLEVTGPGHVVVTVSQPGDNYTLAATPVTVAFDVLRPKLTVRIDNQTATYGDDLTALSLTSTITGFLGSDTEASLAGLPVLSLPPGALHAGSYAITAATAADSFYDFVYEPGTLTVAKASLVILINDVSVAYGATIPTLTFAAEGFVNGETLAALSSQPILATAAAGSDAGDYAITASGFEAADYEITTIAGRLTITPAALEIRADDLTITYGDARPTLTATYAGLVNGDTAASLAVAPNLVLSASDLHAGTYEIVTTDAADPNYTITFVPGTLTVAKAALSITAANQTQVVGRSQPTLTAVFSGFVNGETEGVLATKPQLTTASDGSVGSAAITVFGAVSDDYAITYQAGVIAVVVDEPSFDISATVASPLAGDTPTYAVVIVSAIDGEKVTAGTVQFRFDGVDVGSPVALDANGVASFTGDPLTAGSHTITAVYSGTDQVAAAMRSLEQSVGEYGSTIGLVDATIAASYGERPTYTVQVTPADVANGTPAGTVQWVVDGVDVGAPVALDGSGRATSEALPLLGVGIHTVQARYTSSNGFQGATDSVVLDVARKTLSITGLSVAASAYNGSAVATLVGTPVWVGLAEGESFPVAGTATATFADADAGVAKTVTISGYAVPSDNYVLSADPTITTDILPATVEVRVDAKSKVYGSADPVFTHAVTGLVGSDTLSGSIARVAGENAGEYAITQGTLAVGSNYTLSFTGATLTITKALLTVTAEAVTKTYDGAMASGFSSTISGFVAGEDATVLSGGHVFSGTATTAVNAGVYRLVPAIGTLAAQNYSFAFTEAVVTILRRTLSASLVNVPSKVYDGKVATTLSPANVALSGMVVGESFTVSTAAVAATYASRNASSSVAISVDVAAAGLAAAAGTLAANYEIPSVVTGTGMITTRVLTVTPTGISKTYDGTTSATVALTDNRVVGDLLSLTHTTAQFVDKNVGYKSVLVGGIAMSGGAAANYTVAATARTAASITPRLLAGTVTVADRVYDGSRTATIVGRGLSGLVEGDAVTLDGGTATFASKAVGTGKAVTVTGLALAGAQAGNYEVSATSSTVATITRRTLVVTATAVDKIFDATTAATVVLADDRVTGDTVSVSHTSATFDTAAVGDGKTVTVSGISISGADAANYTVATTTTTTAKIGSQAMAPVITAQPANVSILPGQSATFTATAGGTGVTVQWQRSTDSGVTWADIASARSTTYSVTVALADNGTRVRAVFSNAGGSVTSSVATVTVSKATVASAGVRWGTSGTSALVDAAASGGVVRLLPSGRVRDIPWANINRITFTLNRAITDLTGVTVSGVNGTNYGTPTVTISGTTVTLTLATAIVNADKVTVTINNSQVTGWTRRLDVLPGDVNDDGIVNTTDATTVRNYYTAGIKPLYALYFLDIDGSGTANVSDYNFILTRNGKRLPV